MVLSTGAIPSASTPSTPRSKDAPWAGLPVRLLPRDGALGTGTESLSGMDRPVVTLRAIQARNYRSLRHVDLRFDGGFYVLVGPNGSGKSTLFDAIGFLFDLFDKGLESAVGARTKNFQDLVWDRPREQPGFELAAEFDVEGRPFRYEVRVVETGSGLRIAKEQGYLGHLTARTFAAQGSTQNLVRLKRLPRVFSRSVTTSFFSQGRTLTVSHPDDVSALQFVPFVDQIQVGDAVPETINISAAVAAVTPLMQQDAVQFLQLDSRRLRSASAPNGDDGSRLADDGRNLPRVLNHLREYHRSHWKRWLADVRMSLPGLEDVRTVHRPEDRHDYLLIKRNGVQVPSWVASEGTLRLLALTVIPYLQENPVAYLLEEPENGIHPMAIEFAYQALSTVYGSQVFIASHSPTLLRCVRPAEVLCFGSDPDRGTVIVAGDQHPRLAEWQGSVDDEVFWAADIFT